MNLGAPDSGDTLTLTSPSETPAVLEIAGKIGGEDKNGNKIEDEIPVLNIYNGVTIGPSRGTAWPGGINAYNISRINMYGGVIKDCFNASSSSPGAVCLHTNAVFTMYDGLIENCSGAFGGAVGFRSANPIDKAQFIMKGGTIRNCVSTWLGGGAVCFDEAYVTNCSFIMEGGTIENCTSPGKNGGAVALNHNARNWFSRNYNNSFIMTGGKIVNCGGIPDGYTQGAVLGGAVYVPENNVCELIGGEITGCAAQEGGGVYVGELIHPQFNFVTGKLTVGNDFKLYDNTAAVYGDDIAMDANASVSVGEVTNTCRIDCTHRIVGFYPDEPDAAGPMPTTARPYPAR